MHMFIQMCYKESEIQRVKMHAAWGAACGASVEQGAMRDSRAIGVNSKKAK